MADPISTGIYEIVNLINGKQYIGSAINFRLRWKAHRLHLRRGSHHNRHLQAAWRKYGEHLFEFRILLICDPASLITEEQAAFDKYHPEYNISPTAGGLLGVKHTAETRMRQSASKMGNKLTLGYRHTPETLAKMSAVHTGKPGTTKGKSRPRAAVEKTAAAHRGRKRSPETCAKIAAKAAGRKRSPESVEKGAAKLRGVPLSPERVARMLGNRHARGYKHTDEWKAENSRRHLGSKRPKSAEHRAKISATLTGVPHSPERRANQAAAQLGKRKPRKSVVSE